ncbi:response regulator [Paucibacter sp. R3-3]|uniref:Response regulator n=1 Tax=Roseateles agri TaxID=3098619 RepID=A0ABU5DT83_9BURK|nr:response regulator [Paucibacter sp. R3-3]MDY0749025.1 response regulator [Paucibacter sp. R3-3]
MKTGRRIAVFEDDDAVAELVRRWLGDAGHLVEIDVSMEQIRDFDLVIADVSIPRAAQSLLDSLATPQAKIAILLISARFRKGQEGSIELANELGVQGVLPKPFTKRQLLAAVSQALSRRG